MAKPNIVSRDMLLQAARTCIAERGPERTTLRAVAEQAGVTQGTVFYHFRTKDQLLMEVLRDWCESSWAEMQSESAVLADALASARSRCGFDSPYHRLFFAMMAHSLHQPAMQAPLHQLLARENEQLAKLLESRIPQPSSTEEESGKAAERPKARQGALSPGRLAPLLNALIDGIALQALLDPDYRVDEVYRDAEVWIRAMLDKDVPL
ncbi:TetR/AcrR family transcriptional regulator [Paenibacillus melissococcoides]|uniref:TetR/AcrR family transcriptional regulator n=1 Tax=Paenibacillus melissococcoides TaxID=2912268 RepID=A0ABM9FZE8_9BACL|nr:MULTISPECIES: TetR/AcrR family transcriptional regulator [Paenibacillus]MEB9892027.1 TetR/AcrR family transcriptional regulator [Bacillus cereus]CAH8244645.1 TetR/AcrR family transcriptional regulator [Paenibacillus melissococcoides]CAH8708591.1 TetR/AcrR family transcriptional regulator [Paenibacillus melissococcoides]CAH8709308.1 TetR/AcrR family transcriptional regulator [Paenibacillus melissococcoides]GIO77412.1 TetR family transcriptional regulator [Paenibacillus dendritiformis]